MKPFVSFLAILVTLSACTPAQAAIPTKTSTPPFIITPAPTLTPSSTPVPIVYLNGLDKVPAPEDIFIEKVVSENYLRVMRLTREQVKIKYVQHTAVDGNQFAIMLDETTGIPLAVYTNEWEKATLKFFGKQVGIVMGTDTAEPITETELNVMRDFERAIISGGNYWAGNEPEAGVFNPDDTLRIQSIVDELQNAGITDIIAQAALFGYPEWLMNVSYSKDELREIMRRRVEYVIDNNPHATMLIVVNTPYQYENEGRRDPFYPVWGSYEYIAEAFQMARDYAALKDRNIKLIYNDSDNHYQIGSTSSMSRQIAGMLKERRLIDYLGMETHIGEWRKDAFGTMMVPQMPAEIAYYQKLGIPVLITGLTYQPDENYQLSSATNKLTPDELEARLSYVFGEMTRIAVESGNVQGITFGGLTDQWFKQDDVNWYMIFDENGQPKQSYYVVLRTLYEGLNPSTESVSTLPEDLSASRDLGIWVEEFTNAYGGTVQVDGVTMTASELTEAIRQEDTRFLFNQKIGDRDLLFVVVNNIPLAMREKGSGTWQEVTMARLSEMTGVVFEFSPRVPGDQFTDYIKVFTKVAGKNSRFIFPSEIDTCRIYDGFSTQNWRNIIDNWESIKTSLDAGNVPDGYPYSWRGVYDTMNFASVYVVEPQFRAQHLVEHRSDSCGLSKSIMRLWDREHFSQAEMLKVLEFVVRTRVLQFPEINDWTVEDEMISAHLEAVVHGNIRHEFWVNATGKNPEEITILVADWVKKDNPQAQTYVTEDNLLDFSNPFSRGLRREFDPYIRNIAANNVTPNGLKRVDYIVSENNLSVHYPLDEEKIQAQVDAWKALGLEIGSSETIIYVDERSIAASRSYAPVQLVPQNERLKVQADMYAHLLRLYLDNDIKVFGLGGIDDMNAWPNDVGNKDTEPLLFDDNFRAKPAYYAIVQVLYEHLPTKK